MNIKCLFNKHDYVPIQYVDETTDYEWTYIVHCSRCHKESVHDVNQEAKSWNLIPSSNGTEAYEKLDIEWYVADFADNSVLHTGSLLNCREVLDQNYKYGMQGDPDNADLQYDVKIVSYQNLTKQMKLKLQVHDDV